MAMKSGGIVKRLLAFACLGVLLGSAIGSLHGPAPGASEATPGPLGVVPALSQAVELPGDVFARNDGQVPDTSILYHSPTAGVAFGKGFIAMGTGPAETGIAGSAITYTFPGANGAVPVGESELPWRSNFFRGNDPKGWRTGVANFGSVLYEDLWDGIDLRCRMVGGGLKYEFLVDPHADHSQIRLEVHGHSGLSLAGGSELHISTHQGGAITDSGLDVFYADGERLEARLELRSADSYGFEIPGRDMSRAMVIDPLICSTLLGGSGDDRGTAVATDSAGCAYIAGETASADFPATLGALQTELVYNYDIFVTKFSESGGEVLYSTYLGDEGEDRCTSIAVDSAGRVYLTGYTTSRDFPTTAGAFARTYGGDTFDSFVTCLGPDGTSLVYSTFLGADGVEQGYGIAVDGEGRAHVTGTTWSNFFPVTAGSLTWSRGLSDIFLAKLSPAGNSLEYSCVFGTADNDESLAIALDRWGYAYITGFTKSDAYMASSTAQDMTHNGALDAFVTKVTPSGGAIAYSTYLGGSGGDAGCAIAVGEWGHVYVTGYTMSGDFPTTAGAHDRTFNGWSDVFVATLGRFGESLQYSTFLGGIGGDYGTGITLDAQGCMYVAGHTVSADFPATDAAHSGGTDAFVAKLSPSAGLKYSTCLGGNATDQGRGISLAAGTGYLFVAGETSSAGFPTTAGAPDLSLGGGSDAFLTMLDLTDPVARAGPDRAVGEGSTVNFDGFASTDNHVIVNHTWRFSDGTSNVTRYGESFAHLFPIPGTYRVVLEARDWSGNVGTDSAELIVLDTTLPVADAGPDMVTDEDVPVAFNATGSSDNVGIVNHTWSFTDSGREVELRGAMQSYTFATPGVYEIGLEVADAAGNRATDEMLVRVLDVTAPTADAGRDRAIYRGNPFTFNGTGSRDNAGIAEYIWTFNDGAADIELRGVMPTRDFPVEGVYEVELRVTDGAGNSATDTMVLTVLETVPPVAEAGADIMTDEGVPVRFDGSGCTDNVGVAGWSWTFTEGGNVATLFGISPEWTFTLPGAYEIVLNTSDAAGNWDTDTLTVTVADTLPPEAMPGSNMMVMPGEWVAFNGSGSYDSSGISSHTWAFTHNGTAVVLDGAEVGYAFWTPGAYEVTLTVEDATGKSGHATMTVFVLQPGSDADTGMGNIGPLSATAALLALLAAVLIRRRGGR